ncbi:MAG: lipopolysaccharide biosynthesis protein [Bacteroidales bacterium]|jgi:uncharacterized protein involved in exopolysaccharide biosynthesis|nr:lipopolysaccharide biosynthesis protein [Bacteroidales bacterium]
MKEQNNNTDIRGMENDEEVDIMALLKRFYEKRKFIIKTVVVFFVLGFLSAISSRNRYTADCIFVPQVSSKGGLKGSLSSLASLAGFNLNNMGGNETSLSPMVYPKLLKNVDFQKDLMYSKFHFEGYDKPLSLYDYYTNPKNRKTSIRRIVFKYTFGLPGVILKAIRGEKQRKSVVSEDGKILRTLTNKEFLFVKSLSNKIVLDLDNKNGYFTLSVTMPEPVVAAEVAQRTFDLLQQYITEFKIEKAEDNLGFIQKRYDEAKKDSDEKQLKYAEFSDSNISISSATARIRKERLMSDYNLAASVTQGLAQQLEQAKIQVKEDTPILSAIKPVTVPVLKSGPHRMRILIVWIFFGFVFGCGLVLVFDWLKGQGINWPKKWKLPSEGVVSKR